MLATYETHALHSATWLRLPPQVHPPKADYLEEKPGCPQSFCHRVCSFPSKIPLQQIKSKTCVRAVEKHPNRHFTERVAKLTGQILRTLRFLWTLAVWALNCENAPHQPLGTTARPRKSEETLAIDRKSGGTIWWVSHSGISRQKGRRATFWPVGGGVGFHSVGKEMVCSKRMLSGRIVNGVASRAFLQPCAWAGPEFQDPRPKNMKCQEGGPFAGLQRWNASLQTPAPVVNRLFCAPIGARVLSSTGPVFCALGGREHFPQYQHRPRSAPLDLFFCLQLREGWHMANIICRDLLDERDMFVLLWLGHVLEKGVLSPFFSGEVGQTILKQDSPRCHLRLWLNSYGDLFLWEVDL